jgi:hypothetical protein
VTPDSPLKPTSNEDRDATPRISAALGPWRRVLGREWSVRRAIRALPVLMWSLPVGVLIGMWAGGSLGAAVVIATALGWAGWSLARLLKAPALPHVAEILDLRGATQNRIATGLCFEHHDAAGVFERAAIQDGRRVLAGLTGRRLPAKTIAWPWRQGAAAVLVAVLVLFITVNPQSPEASQDTTLTSHTVALATTDTHVDSPLLRTDSSNRPTANRPAEEGAVSARSTWSPSPDRAEQHDQTSPGQTGAANAVTGGDASASPKAGEREAAPAPNRAADSMRHSSRPPVTAPGSREVGSPSENAMPSGAGRSGGASFSVKHNWIKNIRTASSSQAAADETESDQPEDDDVQDQQQRGGAQPAARDRNVAPSRQLGISGPKGPPGAGRGGPTPIKKSRGTAAMLLGVPTPEMVEGQSRPGPVQRSFRRVTPPQQDRAFLDMAGPVNDDAVWEMETQRWDEREFRFVSDYLTALRREPTDKPIR